MDLRKALSAKRLSIHKRRMDRGGQYIGYITMLFTGGIFVKVFGMDDWWVYIIGAILLIISRYLFGFFDQRIILKNEQKGYSDENPTLMQILHEVEEIKKKL